MYQSNSTADESCWGRGFAPTVTAQAIYQEATDGSWKLRYPAGGNASFWLGLRKLLPDAWFIGLLRRGIER